MREEYERVLKVIEGETEAQNELRRARHAAMEEAERASAGRREGPMTAAESAAAQVARERLAKTVPYTSEKARADAAMLGGIDSSLKRLEDLAIALDRPGIGGPIDTERLQKWQPDRRGRVIDRLLERRAGDIATIRATESVQARQVLEEALRQVRVQGGGTGAIEDFIAALPGQLVSEENRALVARIVAAMPGAVRPEVWSVPGLMAGGIGDQGVLGQSGAYTGLAAKAKAVQAEGVAGAEPELVRQAEFVLQALHKAAEKLEFGADALSRTAPTVVHDHRQFNCKNVGPDARSRQRATRNGENLLRTRSERF
jgi:hypothetical protein